MTRHDKKDSAGRAKMLSGGDTGDRLWTVCNNNSANQITGIDTLQFLH